ncbi:MAG: hypothetical protein APG12_01263 [Candidatus Methanofastidiosum methylothiophilum]|uniref:DUF1232 domain-containing protein n=1 Tax=Candidatus Methanofastidiosum methylothiophilum TaxID=1705564 RepID=A0A150IXP3_9EURY|nr:MAG: hypothetical protein APG10_00959 [Candidatus Methanofastidiosum methylthiophilus]KYC47302.1 MAG: hypothetical protein APG11_01276 [Candidatus Methanofastidiosum methylthiophilus]KYC49741.1 MAG: hypothetical protein APG12_01263 [Candidatus Methanofastidiosum methylthiophilus]
MIGFKELKEKTKSIENDIYALYKAYRDPRVPWYVKIIILFLLGYFISPIDLIPDFIPVIGYIDDILIISVTLYIIIKLIPEEVFQDCRNKAICEPISVKSKWIVTFLIAIIWFVAIYILLRFLFPSFLT